MLWIIICGAGFAAVFVAIAWLSRDSKPGQAVLSGMSAWKLVGAAAAGFGLGVLATLLLRTGDADDTVSTVANTPAASTTSAAPSATSAPSSTTSAPSSTTSAPSSTTSAPSSTAATTRKPRPTRTTKAPTSPAVVPPRIETTTAFYFGRPSETVQIPGRYRGVQGTRQLRVQVLRGGEWSQFPLPVVTGQAGDFRAFVYLGRTGTYQLRIVDPEKRRSSRVLILQLF